MKFQLIWARPIIRDDVGPNPKLPSKDEWFVSVDDKIYPLTRLKSGPPILRGQIEIDKEFNSIEIKEPRSDECRCFEAP